MILYHGTPKENIKSILQIGLKPSRIGIVYLTPKISEARHYGAVLEVETGNNKLTAFDDCKDWEVLCWGSIPPESIKELIGDRVI